MMALTDVLYSSKDIVEVFESTKTGFIGVYYRGNDVFFRYDKTLLPQTVRQYLADPEHTIVFKDIY